MISYSFFFFNDTATTEIYTLSLHDALPISRLSGRPRPSASKPGPSAPGCRCPGGPVHGRGRGVTSASPGMRSEEHTSELQSHLNLVCRLLLEKKKKKILLRTDSLDAPVSHV